MNKKNHHYSKEQVLEKLKKYCAYQERSHHDVRYKILEYKIYGQDLEEIITALIQEDFLNEERYAMAYARGKFNQNEWGRIKILQGLKSKHISDYCVRQAMKAIDPDDYLQSAKKIAEKRIKQKSLPTLFERRTDAIRYLTSRGYEYEIIEQVLAEVD
ncbi:MAG: regulatory protein RecX [Saprospiraceae bacterium]